MEIFPFHGEQEQPLSSITFMNRKKLAKTVVLALVLSGVAYAIIHNRNNNGNGPLTTTYGNVEVRQASLAFNNSERVAEVLVDSGDRVTKGQTLARLETGRIEPLLQQATAQADAQRQTLLRMKNGSRPEEIALAKANYEAARTAAEDAKKRYERLNTLRNSSGVSQQDLDTASANANESAAKTVAALKNYELILAGPRAEDIAEAEARLHSFEANITLLKNQLNDAILRSPGDGVIRTRVMEPGEMASPQKTVLTLALTTPKWVRTYVSEAQLGAVKPGMKVKVFNDSFPEQQITGTVGFIASVAEFTPKTLQTEELRTSLVYEVRVHVEDPDDNLRLGMPVTISFN
jgi:HlyD family secretion protein